mmetsp:Transcript_8129/g.25181  ORF Transcript_8129/g.25181 Transcript_8129/m.25181 type:complete len:201 (+) Transcript_8129:1597-2199(+)
MVLRATWIPRFSQQPLQHTPLLLLLPPPPHGCHQHHCRWHAAHPRRGADSDCASRRLEPVCSAPPSETSPPAFPSRYSRQRSGRAADPRPLPGPHRRHSLLPYRPRGDHQRSRGRPRPSHPRSLEPVWPAAASSSERQAAREVAPSRATPLRPLSDPPVQHLHPRVGSTRFRSHPSSCRQRMQLHIQHHIDYFREHHEGE